MECHIHLLQTKQEPTQGPSGIAEAQRISESRSSAIYKGSRLSAGDAVDCILSNQIR
jgi:hypothetical protein